MPGRPKAECWSSWCTWKMQVIYKFSLPKGSFHSLAAKTPWEYLAKYFPSSYFPKIPPREQYLWNYIYTERIKLMWGVKVLLKYILEILLKGREIVIHSTFKRIFYGLLRFSILIYKKWLGKNRAPKDQRPAIYQMTSFLIIEWWRSFQLSETFWVGSKI